MERPFASLPTFTHCCSLFAIKYPSFMAFDVMCAIPFSRCTIHWDKTIIAAWRKQSQVWRYPFGVPFTLFGDRPVLLPLQLTTFDDRATKKQLTVINFCRDENFTFSKIGSKISYQKIKRCPPLMINTSFYTDNLRTTNALRGTIPNNPYHSQHVNEFADCIDNTVALL